jgi:hypothetical protein
LEIETTADAGAFSEPGDYSDTEDMRKKKSKSKIHVKKKGGAKRSRKSTNAVSKAEKLSENELLDTLIAMRQAQAMDENDYEEACFIVGYLAFSKQMTTWFFALNGFLRSYPAIPLF